MDSKKVYSMLGLCMRAGKLKSGELSVLEAVRGKKAHVVVVSEDASDNTKKLFADKCSYYKVPIVGPSKKRQLMLRRPRLPDG